MGNTKAAKSKTTSTAPNAQQYLAEFEAKQKFIGATLNLGWRLAITFLSPIALGSWIDGRYDTSPSYTLTGLTLAIAASVLVIMRTVKEVSVDTKNVKKGPKV